MTGRLLVWYVPPGRLDDLDALDLVFVLRRGRPAGGSVRNPQPPLELPS